MPGTVRWYTRVPTKYLQNELKETIKESTDRPQIYFKNVDIGI